jgi:hypothetical protein
MVPLTVVTFESTAFNMAEPQDYFINPCCFGDDVAKWRIGELRKQGVETDENRQEDFGWYLNFAVRGAGHCFVIGHRPTGESEEGTWIGWLASSRGFIGSVLSGSKRGIQPLAAQAIHRILSRSPLVRGVRWHFQRDFDDGYEERGASSPQRQRLPPNGSIERAQRTFLPSCSSVEARLR